MTRRHVVFAALDRRAHAAESAGAGGRPRGAGRLGLVSGAVAWATAWAVSGAAGQAAPAMSAMAGGPAAAAGEAAAEAPDAAAALVRARPVLNLGSGAVSLGGFVEVPAAADDVLSGPRVPAQSLAGVAAAMTSEAAGASREPWARREVYDAALAELSSPGAPAALRLTAEQQARLEEIRADHDAAAAAFEAEHGGELLRLVGVLQSRGVDPNAPVVPPSEDEEGRGMVSPMDPDVQRLRELAALRPTDPGLAARLWAVLSPEQQAFANEAAVRLGEAFIIREQRERMLTAMQARAEAAEVAGLPAAAGAEVGTGSETGLALGEGPANAGEAGEAPAAPLPEGMPEHLKARLERLPPAQRAALLARLQNVSFQSPVAEPEAAPAVPPSPVPPAPPAAGDMRPGDDRRRSAKSPFSGKKPAPSMSEVVVPRPLPERE